VRGQTSLPALGVALLLLTATTTATVAVADGAFGTAERDALERQAAIALSERLVDGPTRVTSRANVLDERVLRNVTESFLRENLGLSAGSEAALEIDGEAVLRTGSTQGGSSFERIVLLERTAQRVLRPAFDGTRAVTLPRRVARVRLTLRPPSGTSVTRVLAGHRVVLRRPGGLEGNFTVDLSAATTTTLRFDAVGRLPNGSVTLRYAQRRTRKAVFGVTVDG